MRISVPNHVLAQELEGKMVFLNLQNEQYFSVDEVGARMWQLLNEHGDTERVVAALLGEYEVEESVLASDLNALIARLSEAGLIIVGD
ncbi:MAG TPA: PqqD family protein [Ardenticatenaceae bacterium]